MGTATASGKSASLTLTLPAGVQTNDQVFVATTEPSSTTVTAPSGYTSVASVSSTGGTTPSTTTVYRHAVANGDTALTLTYSSNKTAQAAVLAVYRGIDPSAPVDVSATTSTSSGTMVTAPSVTTTYGSERLAVFQGAAGRFSGKSWTAPSGTTEQTQANATANASMGLADQTLGAAGATGTRVSTFGASANLTTVMLATPTPPAVLFAHADHLGSTRLLTDSAGVVRASFTYDPYGNVTASSGSSTTPFAFAGQYRDAENGFYYLHARYYDPATAQFLRRDQLTGISGSPYGYATDNPPNASDPSGLLYSTGDSGATAGGLSPFQQVYSTLSAVLLQEGTMQKSHSLSASAQSDLVGSIEGLMNQVYTEQAAITDRCSSEAVQLQAAIGAAASTEEDLVWKDNEQNIARGASTFFGMASATLGATGLAIGAGVAGSDAALTIGGSLLAGGGGVGLGLVSALSATDTAGRVVGGISTALGVASLVTVEFPPASLLLGGASLVTGAIGLAV